MMKLNRAQLAEVFKNHETLRAFEQMNVDVTTAIPGTIEEANALAGQAAAIAYQAISTLASVLEEVERLSSEPAFEQTPEQDDTAPRAQLGTMSSQNHDAIDITGGMVGLDAGDVGAPSFYLGGDTTTGLYRSAMNSIAMAVAGVKLLELSSLLVDVVGSLRVSQQIISTVATGTAPLQVTSTTLVPNLHVAVADSLGTPGTYPADATDLATVITLANAIKAQNIARGV